MSKSSSVLCAAVAAVVACAFPASAETLTWNGAAGAEWNATDENWLDENSEPTNWIGCAHAEFPGDADVAVEGVQQVGNLVFASEGSDVRTLAGGTLDFTANGGVISNAQGAVIGSDLVAKIRSDDVTEGLTYPETRVYDADTWLPADPDNNKTGTWVTYWKNRKLGDIFGIGDCTLNKEGTPYDAVGCFYRYDASTGIATCQIQTKKYNTTQIIVVKIELRQSGDDIEVRVIGAGYDSATGGLPGKKEMDDSRLGFYSISNTSAKGLVAKSAVLVSGEIAYGAGIKFVKNADEPLTSKWITYWKDRRLAGFTDVQPAGKMYFNSDVTTSLGGYFYEYDPATDTATFQAQSDKGNGQFVAARMELRQVGDDIQMRVNGVAYFSGAPGSAKVADDRFASQSPTYWPNKINIETPFAATEGRSGLTVACPVVPASSAYIASSENEVTLWENRRLADVETMWGTMTTPENTVTDEYFIFEVAPDGQSGFLTIQNQKGNGPNNLLTAIKFALRQDGNDVKIKIAWAKYNWAGAGKTETLPFDFEHVGGGVTTDYDRYFSQVNKIKARFKPVTLAGSLADVTGDIAMKDTSIRFGGAAFAPDGAITGNGGVIYSPLSGSQTVTLSNANAYTGSTRVAGATAVTLEDAEAIPAGSEVTVEGATLSVAEGIAAVTPKLTVTGAATLTFADGASLEADDIDLSAAETVTVVAAEGAKWMKVGRALTKDELKKFAPGDGFRAKQDADGWLFAERIPGAILIVR